MRQNEALCSNRLTNQWKLMFMSEGLYRACATVCSRDSTFVPCSVKRSLIYAQTVPIQVSLRSNPSRNTFFYLSI